MRFALDFGKGIEALKILERRNIVERVFEKAVWYVDRALFPEKVRQQAEAFLYAGGNFDEAVRLFYGKIIDKTHFDGNLLLNEGINALWTLVAGGSETAYNNANARLGVGSDATAESASQTGLIDGTPTFKAMDATYPTYGTSQKITFRSTFGGTDANEAWNEFTADNGDTANKNLNRKVSSQGTKSSGQTWQLTLDITLS